MEFYNNEAERNAQFKFAENTEAVGYSDARRQYEQRRNAAENFFIEHPPVIAESERDGARFRTALARWDVPADLKKETRTDVLRVTIYVPGMFEADKPNFGNYPLETKLAGGMLTGDTDAIFMLKGEGLNAEAYAAKSGESYGESLVADVAVGDLERSVKDLKQKLGAAEDMPVEFEVVGYSEGSAQGASIAEKILEHNLGKVRAYTSVGGAGLVGPDNQNEAGVLAHLASNTMRKKDDYSIPKTYTESGPDTYILNSKMIGYSSGNKVEQYPADPSRKGEKVREVGGLEHSLGKAYVDTTADARNIAKWGLRYVGTALGLGEEVPHERVQAVFSRNHDFDKLAERGIPIAVLAGSKEIMFPAVEVQKSVEQLRAKGGKVLLLITDMGHSLPHENPSGTAMMLQLFRNKVGI